MLTRKLQHEFNESALCAMGMDVLTEITRFVHDSSRPDVFNLVRVNRLLQNVARPFIVRECALNFEVDEILSSHARILRWLTPDSQDHWVLSKIRRLSVFGTPGDAGLRKEVDVLFDSKQKLISRKEKWEPIVRLIPALRNLVHFTFACPRDRIPCELLQVLEESHPQVRLSIRHWEAGAGRDASNIELHADDVALARSPLLRNIEMNHPHKPWDASYVLLSWIVSCSNHLDSVIVNPPAGLAGTYFRGTAEIHRRRAETIFKVPSIIGKKEFRCLRLMASSISFTDFCGQVGKLSSLEDLQTLFPSPLLRNPKDFNQLISIKRLQLSLACTLSRDDLLALQELLQVCAPLETLCLTGHPSIYRLLSVITTHHGESLNYLILRPHRFTLDGLVCQDIVVAPAARLVELDFESPLAEGISSQIDTFLRQSRPFEAIWLKCTISLLCLLPMIVVRHGPSLHDLSLLQGKSPITAIVPPSARDIALIRETCPHLRKLTLNIVRDQSVGDISVSLSQFRSILDLTLVFPEGFPAFYWSSAFEQALLGGNEIGETEAALAMQLPVYPSFALRIFENISVNNCSIQRLTIMIGERRLRTIAQKFIVSRGGDGTGEVQTLGYILPPHAAPSWSPDPSIPKQVRLQRLWQGLFPNLGLPKYLQTTLPQPVNN
ncbi:hypothetical protein DL96DRAFT_1623229 [Flagelloscypha sp. PMI_526]|nr:hypothetical protein DL96DRAFT_1623229 [Flagelloscypha sp. PMI_526]